MSPRPPFGPLACLMGALLNVWLAAPSPADVVVANYTSPTNFSYLLLHMPDMDQRRSLVSHPNPYGLPGNGSMYCVPSSTMNMLMYIANHGFPLMGPGPGNWQSNTVPVYNGAGLSSDNMGALMGTTTTGGTGGNGWYNGTRLWINMTAVSGQFTVTPYYMTPTFTPRFSNLAEVAIGGSLVSLGYGRYEVVDETVLSVEVGERVGGHIVTFVRGSSNGFSHTFAVRDPADDPNNTSQSLFTNRNLDAINRTILFCPQGQNCYTRGMTSLNYTSGDERISLIDGYLGVRPKTGYSFTNTGSTVNLHTFAPFLMTGSNLTPSRQFTLPGVLTAKDVVIHPDLAGYVLLLTTPTGGPDTIQILNALNGQTELLASVPNAKRFVFGRKRNLYVLVNGARTTGDRLHLLELHNSGDPVIVNLPSPAQALAYNDATDEVVLLSVPDRRIIWYADGLQSPPTFLNIPVEIPLMGEASITVNPTDATMWLISEASDTIFGVQQGAGGVVTVEQITLPGIQNPTSVDFDDAGHLFLSANGGEVVELMHTPGATGWEQVADSAFEGLAVGPMFRVTRSRTNFDPDLHTGPAFNNIDPDELTFGEPQLDCLADINISGAVDVDDLISVILAWGDCPAPPGSCLPDTNSSGVVDVDDLISVILQWGACP